MRTLCMLEDWNQLTTFLKREIVNVVGSNELQLLILQDKGRAYQYTLHFKDFKYKGTITTTYKGFSDKFPIEVKWSEISEDVISDRSNLYELYRGVLLQRAKEYVENHAILKGLNNL